MGKGKHNHTHMGDHNTDYLAQAAHNTIGSGSYSMAHHDAVNYGIPDTSLEFDGGSKSRGGRGGKKKRFTDPTSLLAGQSAMGGQGGHQKYHDRMLWAKTTIGKLRFKNAIFLNLKEVRRFYSIWNISFISVVMCICLWLWVYNPEMHLNPEEHSEVCYDVANCSLTVHCWDNKYMDSVVMAPPGFYPTEHLAVSQGQVWDADKAQYVDATALCLRWFMLGFFLSAFNLGKEITHLCCWHKKSKDKIYDVHHYNALEFRAALKQF